jgi:hypothetical protein
MMKISTWAAILVVITLGLLAVKLYIVPRNEVLTLHERRLESSIRRGLEVSVAVQLLAERKDLDFMQFSNALAAVLVPQESFSGTNRVGIVRQTDGRGGWVIDTATGIVLLNATNHLEVRAGTVNGQDLTFRAGRLEAKNTSPEFHKWVRRKRLAELQFSEPIRAAVLEQADRLSKTRN